LFKVVDQPGGGAALVMEYIQFGGGLSKYSALLGQQLAKCVELYFYSL
jgi:hypothetical protein